MHLMIRDRRAELDRLAFQSVLSGGLKLEAEFAGPCEPLQKNEAALLHLGRQTWTLTIDDFARSRRQRSWLMARDAASVAAPYRRETFSGAEGSSLGRAIEARCPVAQAPPELYRLAPAIQVDAPLTALLDAACAQQGWSWWFEPQGLRLGTIGAAARAWEGEWETEVPQGTWHRVRIETEDDLPLPGQRAACDGNEGYVLHTRVVRERGVVVCHVLLGELTVSKPLAPQGTDFLDVTVQQLNPVMVAYVGSEGRQIVTQATPMKVETLAGKVQLRVPVEVGDRGRLELIAGGVEVRTPCFLPLTPDTPPEDLMVVAPRVLVESDEHQIRVRRMLLQNVERIDIDE